MRKVRTRSGAVAVQIAEREGGRDRVVEHLGSAHGDAELASLLAVAQEKLHAGEDTLDIDVGGSGPGTGLNTVLAESSRLLWDVLCEAYDALGFGAVKDATFKELVLGRVIEPVSKADTIRVLDDIGVPHSSLRTVFRCLGRVHDLGYRDVLTRQCFEHASASGDISLVLYDVTTLYFEAEKEDDLRKVGYSKERRVDPQIVVGLLVDRAGFPLEIGMFEGDKAETRTLLPVIERFQKRHNLADMVVVADAGMLSDCNLSDLASAQLKFIVGSRQTKAPSDLASHFHWHGDAFMDGQIVDTVTPRGRHRNTNSLHEKAEPVWDPGVHGSLWRAIWAYSRSRAVRDRHTLTEQYNRAQAIINGDKTVKKPRFVKEQDGTVVFDDATYERAKRLAGLKGYVTNIPVTAMSAAEVISHYHDLWHVEQSFRMSKTDLRARPIFHHLKDSIDAHLTIVFAALAVSRYLYAVTGYTVPRIVKVLRPIRDVTMLVAGHPHTGRTALTPESDDLLRILAEAHPRLTH